MPTPGKRSSGSKLGAIAGLIITIGFFLPWIRACNVIEVSGFDLATDNQHLDIKNPWAFWVTLLAGLVCILLYALANKNSKADRIRIATARLITGILGLLPVIALWDKVQRDGRGIVELLYGGWVTLAGYVGILLSFIVDLTSKSTDTVDVINPVERNIIESNRVLVLGAAAILGSIVLFLILNRIR